MRDHGTRRPIPTEQSIHWKPLQDPHYVVASLQPGDGGRRPIFIRQQVLARIEALVRGHGRRVAGLLIGQFYHCQATGADYLIIESIAEQPLVSDETEMAAGITEAIANRSADHRAEVIGWYRGVSAVDSKPSPSTAATHTSLFTQPWQVTLVVGEGAETSHGAFFLRDGVNSRWFHAPFYELLEQAPSHHEPKPTVVDWPHHYITAVSVAPASSEVRLAAEWADSRAKSKYERPNLERPQVERAIAKVPAAEPAVPPPPSDVGVPLVLARPESVTPMPAQSAPAEQVEALTDAPLVADRPAPQPVHAGLADVAQPARERPLPRRGFRSNEKLSIVDDRDQRSGLSADARRIGDTDDTSASDDPARYIAIARAEGFFIAAKFDTMSHSTPSETLWILNEPFSGMLLAVIATDSEVVDATLHYNLQTDEAGLGKTPFREHCDAESKTIYVRETCVDALRARCRRLRATNSLVREWKVTPTIWFLTPAEWESVPGSDVGIARGAAAVVDLNNSRIAELPAGIRGQFHLAGGDEANA